MKFFLLFVNTISILSLIHCESMSNQLYQFTDRHQRYWQQSLRMRAIERLIPHAMAIIDETSLPFYVGEPELPTNFANLSQKAKECVVQSNVMRRYGGIWIDSDLYIIDTNNLVLLMDIVKTPDVDSFWLIENEGDEDTPLYSVIVSKRNSTLMQLISAEQYRDPFIMTRRKLKSFISQLDGSQKVIIKEGIKSFRKVFTDCRNDKQSINSFILASKTSSSEIVAHVICRQNNKFAYLFLFVAIFFILILINFLIRRSRKSETTKII